MLILQTVQNSNAVSKTSVSVVRHEWLQKSHSTVHTDPGKQKEKIWAHSTFANNLFCYYLIRRGFTSVSTNPMLEWSS